jgi:hypothetical protein
LSELNENHIARKFATERKLPDYTLELLYYTSDLRELAPKFSKLPHIEPRVLIPFKRRDGVCVGFSGRALLDVSNIRYLSYKADKTQPCFFGLDRLNLNKTVYIVEGAFDSMFLPNSIAAGSSDFNGVISALPSSKKFVIIRDNEPRSKELGNKLDKEIEKGYNVVVWSDDIEQKDINDMVLAGIDVEKFIEENTYSGMTAKLKFNSWRKY